MTSREFVYWLQGYFELSGSTSLTIEQAQCIKRHLAMVFAHEIDPSAGTAEQQEKLNEVHGPGAQTIGGDGPGGTKYRC